MATRPRPLPCALLATALSFSFIETSRSDPFLSLWVWALDSGKSHRRFSAADPEPEKWACHNDVRLVEAGGHPDFHIVITGDCAFVPANFNPVSGTWDPAWIDVTWRGTYDYETGVGSERLKRDGGAVLYDVNLQCEPGKNPFIYTGNCAVTSSDGPSPDGTQGGPPLSGGRLDGVTRQNLINWEQAATSPQEGEGMDLAPNADPPRIVSPTSGGSYPNGVQVAVKPSTRGVPRSTTYELAFFFQKPFPATGGVMKRAATTTRALTEIQPSLTKDLDWNQTPNGIQVTLGELGRSGHWTVRARMKATPGAEWSAPVAFTAGIESKTAAPAQAAGGLAPIGEKRLGTMRGRAQPRATTPTTRGAASSDSPTEKKRKAEPVAPSRGLMVK